MVVISEASKPVLSVLKPFLKTVRDARWSQYCVRTPIEDGILVFNLLTRELVLLSQNEYAKFYELDYLMEHWFVVSKKAKEKEMADFVKLVLTSRRTKPREITSYTIFTTTDCNARCFYCFELGRSRIPMSCETAEKVVQYIKTHCRGKQVSISWFGGEPLFNVDAIDTIARGLQREKIEFSSKMVSNGYLFDDEIVHRAVRDWNLKKVQISLDGTEKVYNKIKSYIYRDTNPFEIVMKNIASLLQSDIGVSIRLNMDLYNADDLLALSGELSKRFQGKKGISVYVHHLFKSDTPDAELHSEAEWELRVAAMDRLNKTLEENGLLSKSGIYKNIKLNHCMADSGTSVTILPDGNLGLCEHCTENEFVGHIDQDVLDVAVVKSWKERVPEIPECADCFYYLDCIKLKKCSTDSVCYPQFRQEKLKRVQRAMLNEYEQWLTKSNEQEDDENSFC